MREPSNIKIPSPRITDPTLTRLCRVPVLSPHRMRQDLQYFLGLGIAVRVARAVWLLLDFGIPGSAVHMVGFVGEVGLVRAVYSGPIWEGVDRWAVLEVVWPAPRLRLGIYDHLAVPGNVCLYIAVARLPVVLPTASNVH